MMPPDYCKCYCENNLMAWNKKLCIILSLFISSCVGLGIGICLKMMEQQRDSFNLSVLEQQKEQLTIFPEEFHKHNHSSPQKVPEKGTFKSITNGTFAVYNAVGDLLYLMENVRKEDGGDVVFSEFEDYHSAENVHIDIKLIEAPQSVLQIARS